MLLRSSWFVAFAVLVHHSPCHARLTDDTDTDTDSDISEDDSHRDDLSDLESTGWDSDDSHHQDRRREGTLQDEELRDDGSSSESSLACRIEHMMDLLGPTHFKDKTSKFLRAATVVCPRETITPEDELSGVNLFFYVPNDPKAIVIREVKPDMWRRDDLDRLIAKGFDANKQTLIYLGGWMQREDVYWLQTARKTHDRMATENKGEAPFNLLIFDWADYAYTPNYSKSVATSPYVARVLANLMEQLIDHYDFKAELMHLISYSLSTHIVGLAARLVKGNGRGLVGQITAIDPTGVCFDGDPDNIFDRDYSLRATDAKLVLARHYNIGLLGSGRLIGGLDILVNGGKKQHSMHLIRKDPIELLGYTCFSHIRASQHEEAPFSTDSDCHEMAYECSDYSKFKMGQCAKCGQKNESCFLVNTLGHVMLGQKPGGVSFKLGTQMHISTGFAQFCAYQYQVVAQLKPNPSDDVLRAFAKGKFRFRLDEKLLVKPKYRLDEDGIKFTRLMQLDKKVERFPNQIDVSGLKKELLDSLESVSINFMSHISAEHRARSSFRYCPDESDMLLVGNCLKTLG